jgi:hypothetical protein
VYFSAVPGLWRVPVAGGAPVELATDDHLAIALDDQFIFYADDTGIERLPLSP